MVRAIEIGPAPAATTTSDPVRMSLSWQATKACGPGPPIERCRSGGAAGGALLAPKACCDPPDATQAALRGAVRHTPGVRVLR